MLGWSGLLYIAPLVILLPDDREIRYVYWFLAASLIALTHFCSGSPLIRSLFKSVIDSWETKIRGEG